MSAYREDVANVITLTVSSEDPNKAARIQPMQLPIPIIATSQEARAKSIKIANPNGFKID